MNLSKESIQNCSKGHFRTTRRGQLDLQEVSSS